VHLTYRYTTIYYSQAPAGGAGVPGYWRESFAIDEGYFSRMARDSKGVLHLVFTQNVQTASCRICYHVFYVRSTDDGSDVERSRRYFGAADRRRQATIDR
jgi:hypothetical protein